MEVDVICCFDFNVLKCIDEMSDIVVVLLGCKIMIDYYFYFEDFCRIIILYFEIFFIFELVF